ncbi:MAG: geranylgeranyl reductase family protein [Deltaproteobacteria bacterium]|nr:geranylgeranyl reductase family protein [Deltaproteobacteria bacterium]
MYDAIIAGLGPAGSTAAYTLATKGWKVLGIDKARFPRYKSCGGCISTKIERILDFDIKETLEETAFGATFTYKTGRTMDILSDRPVGYNVMRDVFDNHLLNKAKEAGAEVIEGLRIRGVAEAGGVVTVFCDGGLEFRAKFLIGSDGASGVVGREHFGLDPKEAAISITAEVPYGPAGKTVQNRLFIDFGSIPFGYGWIFPKKDCLSVGIAGDAAKVGGRVKDYFNEFVSTHETLKGLKIDHRDGWTVPVFYTGAATPVRGRVILAGDTGHLVDPFLGEGIYYAIRTAKAASVAIDTALKAGDADLSAYKEWLEKEVYTEFRAAEKLSDLVYNHPRLWYSIIEKDHEIMQRYYNVIRGEEAVDSFYNWAYNKVKSKPWRVLRRWLESRFMDA